MAAKKRRQKQQQAAPANKTTTTSGRHKSGKREHADARSSRMIPERTLVKISATFTAALVAILVFNNLEPSEPTQTITIHLCQLHARQPEPIQNKVLAHNNRTLVNLVGHLRFVRRPQRRRLAGPGPSAARRPLAPSYNQALQWNHGHEDPDTGVADDQEEEEEPAFVHASGHSEEPPLHWDELEEPAHTKYLPLKLFFVHQDIIDQDQQELYLVCMCAAFKLRLQRLHNDTWTTRDLPQEASTYIHSRKQEYQDFYLDQLEFDQVRSRFHCDQPWQVPIEKLTPASKVDKILRPYDEVWLHIDQLDLELDGGPLIRQKVFTKPIQECPPLLSQSAKPLLLS